MMGFFLQLRILLWKNLTLKRRSPLVLMFEIFIPLVLFIILLCIRHKQPAHPMPDSHWLTKPLPSAGVLALMQQFCVAGDYDQLRFSTFPNSSVTQLLDNIQQIAEHNNFFDPGFRASEMDDIPELYHRIIDDPALLHDRVVGLKNVELKSVLVNVSQLVSQLSSNLSLPADSFNALVSAELNFTELYRILFGDSSIAETRERIRRKRDTDVLPEFSDELQKHLSDMSGISGTEASVSGYLTGASRSLLDHLLTVSHIPADGIVYQLIRDNPKLLLNPEVRQLVMRMLEAVAQSQMDSFLETYDLNEMIALLEHLHVTPAEVHDWMCTDDEYSRLLISTNETSSESIKTAGRQLCSLPADKWSYLLDQVGKHVDLQSILNQVDVQNGNFSLFISRVEQFELNLEKFLLFEKTLVLLSTFASHLPQNLCPAEPWTDVSAASTDNEYLTTASHTDEADKGYKSTGDDASSESSRNAGLIRIWVAMQTTLCGQSVVSEDMITKSSRDIGLNDLGFSQTQLKSIGMLVHALYNNPKVLYAPNNSAANLIINKANGTFSLVDAVSEYALKWKTISTEIREYLLRNTTEHNINEIIEMHRVLHRLPGLWHLLKSREVRDFVSNPLDTSVMSRASFVHQLDNVDEAACSWLAVVSGININVFHGFETEDDLVSYFLNDAYANNVTVIASVVFENVNTDGTLPPHLVYKIRQNASFTASTKSVRDKYWHPGPGSSLDGYYQFGFVWLQDIIERAVINVQTGRDVLEPGTFVHQMPHPCYMEDRFLFMIEHVMPLCLTISWVYTVAMLVQSVVYEKEQRLKEVMRMMGLNNAVHWLAWFLTTFTQMSITMAILTVMLKFGGVLMYSNALIIFLVLQVFAVATIAFSFLVSVCYSKAKVAAACAGIVYFLSYVPYMYVAIREEAAGDRISAVVKSLVSVLSTTAFGLGAKYFAFYEIEGVGVQWDNIAVSPVEDDEFSLQLVVLMMVFDALFYGLLTWYIENVHPGSFGLPKPWYFPLTTTYWCGGQHAADTDVHCSVTDCLTALRYRHGRLSVVDEDQACAMDQPLHASNFEMEPQHLVCGVRIDKLTKVYKTGKLAVNKLSLNLYESQITSFLGHNGAGKTTTMSILTGLFPPTAGYATVYGLDIRTDMEEIRKTLGMCPQHNVLFDKLTVEEHMWIYARLKGMPVTEISTEMDRMIDDLGLLKKRRVAVNCLSGGMKRKLSVAIAFVAGSRTVVLDEPTAGVDPYARRAIWDLILKYKHGRTILLSTHHMDEADILGDRIAIISNGQLQCCGSSLFLKSTFGEGYHLVLVKNRSEEDLLSADTLSIDDTRTAFNSRCSEDKVTSFISRHLQAAYLKAETNHELHYILPFDEAKKGRFEKLFSALDSALDELHIASFGIADTSLEEVFLKITESPPTVHTSSDNTDEAALTNKPDNSQLVTAASHAVKLTNHRRQLSADSASSLQSSLLLVNADDVELNRFTRNVTTSPLPSVNDSEAGDVRLLDPSSVRLKQTDNAVVEIGSAATGTGYVSQDYSGASAPDEPLLSNAFCGSPCKQMSTKNDDDDDDDDVLCGPGPLLVQSSSRLIQQFFAILVKRCYYVRRNWKGLFSQILLPALFVCVAMTVALTAPQVQDLPAIVLSPAQYYNYTQPRGNFIPTSLVDCDKSQANCTMSSWSKDADAKQVLGTFHLASGVAATCVLKSPFNSLFDADRLRSLNFTSRSQQLLERYFEPDCESVFVKGLPMMNFVPPAPVFIDSTNVSSPLASGMVNLGRPRYHPDCKCTKDHTGQICKTAGFEVPPSFQAVTAEYIQDITGETEEQFYLSTQDLYRLHRYGGYSFGLVRDEVPENFGKNGPTQFRKLAVRHVTLVWFDNKGYHALPIYLNALNNAILRANLPKDKGNEAAYGITAINHPMNNTNNQLSLDFIKQGSDVLIAIFAICAMSFVPASFVVFLVYERAIKAKHLQIVSGLNRVIYWLANYVWDMFNYLIPGTCCIIILKVFDIPAYVSSTNFPAVISLFLLYGWSITPMMYPASFIFTEPSTAYIFLIVINLFIGITCIITSFLLELFQLNSKDLAHIHEILKNVFLIFPNYCLGRGLMDVAFNEYYNEFCFKMGMYDKMKSPFEWKLTARNMVAMAVMGFIFFGITLLCEFRFFIQPRRRRCTSAVAGDGDTAVDGNVIDEDEDVMQERRRVLRGSGRHDLVQLKNLSKVFTTKKLGRQLAVDRVCLGVPAGECFGLLGVNGAGKTTTFQMLTGDLQPTSGDATLSGYSILTDIYQVQNNVGYCPQSDALYDELTAREHLQLYSRLRGVPPRHQHKVIDWALDKLGLTQYADKTSSTYSGGNKRKLSTAIALLGKPPVVFLDEPTTGMDPCSRRFLWNLILGLISDGTSVILTSHSMEECEVLCTRLAVMVNGRLRCLGSTQHLKNKFGDGYTMIVRMRSDVIERDVMTIKQFITRRLQNAQLKECHHNMLQYEFPSSGLCLSSVFAVMEEACRDLPIDDYSINQNTLDNVFINFVKKQQEIVQETVSDDGNFQPSLAVGDAGNFPQSSLAASDDEALIDVSEDEGGIGRLFDGLQARLAFLNMETSA